MRPLLTYEEVGRLFGMSKWWVMKQRRLGKIKPIYFGPMVRFEEEEVERFLKEWNESSGRIPVATSEAAPNAEADSNEVERLAKRVLYNFQKGNH